MHNCIKFYNNEMLEKTANSMSFVKYMLNAKNFAPLFLSIVFWIKIDDFKNQCSLAFMPVQKTIVVEEI